MRAWIVTDALGQELRSVRVTCKKQTGPLRGAYLCIYKVKNWEGDLVELKEIRDRKQIYKTKKAADAKAIANLTARQTALRCELDSVGKNIYAIESGKL